MSYRELKAKLATMNDNDLDLDVTVYNGSNNEFHAVSCFESNWKDDTDNVAEGVLDSGHPYLIF